MEPIDTLYEDVVKKSLMRLEYEGLSKCEAITGGEAAASSSSTSTPSSGAGRYHNDPVNFALDRYAYYVCFKCGKAYYGGQAQCDADAGIGDNFNPGKLALKIPGVVTKSIPFC